MKKRCQIDIERIVKEETRNASGRLGFLNNLAHTCLKNGLTPEEYTEVYEKVIRNMMKICESRLKLSISKKEMYKNEIAKASCLLCTDESNHESF